MVACRSPPVAYAPRLYELASNPYGIQVCYVERIHLILLTRSQATLCPLPFFKCPTLPCRDVPLTRFPLHFQDVFHEKLLADFLLGTTFPMPFCLRSEFIRDYFVCGLVPSAPRSFAATTLVRELPPEDAKFRDSSPPGAMPFFGPILKVLRPLFAMVPGTPSVARQGASAAVDPHFHWRIFRSGSTAHQPLQQPTPISWPAVEKEHRSGIPENMNGVLDSSPFELLHVISARTCDSPI